MNKETTLTVLEHTIRKMYLARSQLNVATNDPKIEELSIDLNNLIEKFEKACDAYEK